MLTGCPQCAYDLHGLPEVHTCPECGFAYDKVAEVISGARKPPRAGGGQPKSAGARLLAAWCLVAVQGVVLVALGVAISVVMVLVVVWGGSALVMWRRRWRVSRWAVVGRSGIAILCDHLPPRSIAWSDVGAVAWSRITGSVVIRGHGGAPLVKLGPRVFGTTARGRDFVDRVHFWWAAARGAEDGDSIDYPLS